MTLNKYYDINKNLDFIINKPCKCIKENTILLNELLESQYGIINDNINILYICKLLRKMVLTDNTMNSVNKLDIINKLEGVMSIDRHN